MLNHRFTGFLSAMTILAACSDANPPNSEPQNVAPTAAPAPEEAPNPCELLPESVVREVFELNADTALEGGQGEHVRHVCSYRWANPDYDPRDHARRLMKRFQPQRGSRQQGDALIDEIVDAPAFFTASITLPEADSSEEQAHARIVAASERLAEGVSAMSGETEVTFRSRVDEVEGVGDEAVWFVRTRELLLRAGAQRITVGARVSAEDADNVEASKRLARAVLARRNAH